MTQISLGKATWLALATSLAILVADPNASLAQCPNNCTGHGTCIPSQKNKRLECDCYEGWTGNACSQRETAAAKAKREEQVIIDVPEEDTRSDTEHSGKPMTGVREFEEVAESSWSDLQPREEALLKELGWRKDPWNNRNSGRAQWPPSMYMPFNALKRSEQSAVTGLGFTPKQWNTGKHVTILTQRGS